jgi:hypothetical protein
LNAITKTGTRIFKSSGMLLKKLIKIRTKGLKMEFYYVIFRVLETEVLNIWAKGREKDIVIISASLSARSVYVKATPRGIELLQKCFANVLTRVVKA